MKALAEFAMRGRFQALLITVIGAGSLLFSPISAAVLALVTLRKGAGAGAWLLFWGLLPAGALVVWYGDASSLALLLGVMILALVLRTTVSLSLAVLAGAGVGLLTGALLLLFSGAMLDQLVAAFDSFLASMEQQLSEAEGGADVTLPRPSVLQVAGLMGTGSGALALASLMLARYWQAALYNPGGFGEEFRALSLPPAVASALALGALAIGTAGLEYRGWAMSLLLPLTFCGLALGHSRAHWAGWSGGWLAAFYAAWVLLDPLKLLLVLLAVADSFKGFRRNWAKPEQGNPDDGDPE